MGKFLAVVKREYVQRVRTKMFIVVTILAPLVMSLFAVVPALIFSIKAGRPIRIAVVDQTGKLYSRLYRSVENEVSEPTPNPTNVNALNADTSERFQQGEKQRGENFELEEIRADGRSLEQIKSELTDRVRKKDLDGYLILPEHLLKDGTAEFFGRNTGDLFTTGRLQNGLSRAAREQRFAEAGIKADVVRELSKSVQIQSFKVGEKGAEHDSGEGFILVFASGFIIHL